MNWFITILVIAIRLINCQPTDPSSPLSTTHQLHDESCNSNSDCKFILTYTKNIQMSY